MKKRTAIQWKVELLKVAQEDMLLPDEYSDNALAFMSWLIYNDELNTEDYEDIEELLNDITENGNYFEHSAASGEYRILTDTEADEAWNESIDSYIDDCILPDVPENVKDYLDIDRMANDIQREGSRGQQLNYYDGYEHDIEFNGCTFYIYRTN